MCNSDPQIEQNLSGVLNMNLIPIFILFACQSTDKGASNSDLQNGSIIQDRDEDGYTADEDCDDDDATINPGASELCDGIDNDCNGEADERVTTTFYADGDGDGYGNPLIMTEACEEPIGYVANGLDCSDANAVAYPGAEEICDGVDNDCNDEVDENLDINFYVDSDGDGYGDDENIVTGCQAELGLSTLSGDCNDSDPSISPIANEICDEVDNNCDGSIDNDATSTFYADHDEDGYGSSGNTVEACSAPAGYVGNMEDCDDIDSEVHPQADELCDTVDNDCDGAVDEEGAIDGSIWYRDADGDGYGNNNNTTVSCSQPTEYVSNNTDCDDANGIFNPGATESCNGFDDDCDGDIDEEGSTNAITFYADSDNDGFGDSNTMLYACSIQSGYVTNSDDCNDNDENIYLNAIETCNGKDDNCNDEIDEYATDMLAYYVDLDGDGFGDPTTQELACSLPTTATLNDADCDDTNAGINPSATEICDSIDNNCDQSIDEDSAIDASTWYVDHDLDGYGALNDTLISCAAPSGYSANSDDCDDTDLSINPVALEYCDSTDHNCDGSATDNASDGIVWNIDYDGDGYGSNLFTITQCTQPSYFVADDSDCDDTEANRYPGAVEICDEIDNDCDGYTDDEDNGLDLSTATTFYADGDADGYGTSSISQESCVLPLGYSENDEDCNDSDHDVNPLADEIWYDGIDQDCDDLSDYDQDGDGYDSDLFSGLDCDDEDEGNFDACSVYDFTSHTFTNCGSSGRYGPSLSDCTSEYSTTWDDNSDYFSMNTTGIQRWMVPESGTYQIEVYGAASGTNSNYTTYQGLGAQLTGEFELVQNEVLQILVGQVGQSVVLHAGGGGGSFVVDEDNIPLIIAGGGGAPCRDSDNRPTTHGTINNDGNSSTCSSGSSGTGGSSCGASYGSGGGGFSGDGSDGAGASSGGLSFLNGGAGGECAATCGYNAGAGGFGGGGGTYHDIYGGGGGGYSGGGGGDYCSGGGGGGSYNIGSNTSGSNGINSGDGYVIITKL